MTTASTVHKISSSKAPFRAGLVACALGLCMALAQPVLAGKKNDTLGMAYDQTPENIDPYFNNVRIA